VGECQGEGREAYQVSWSATTPTCTTSPLSPAGGPRSFTQPRTTCPGPRAGKWIPAAKLRRGEPLKPANGTTALADGGMEPLRVVGVVGGGAGSVAGDEPLETDGESADSTPLARSQTARRAISRRQVLSRRLTRSIDGWRYVDFATLGDSERDVRT
jgi:hypothetical protein